MMTQSCRGTRVARMRPRPGHSVLFALSPFHLGPSVFQSFLARYAITSKSLSGRQSTLSHTAHAVLEQMPVKPVLECAEYHR
jgi:hypothetical protein